MNNKENINPQPYKPFSRTNTQSQQSNTIQVLKDVTNTKKQQQLESYTKLIDTYENKLVKVCNDQILAQFHIANYLNNLTDIQQKNISMKSYIRDYLQYYQVKLQQQHELNKLQLLQKISLQRNQNMEKSKRLTELQDQVKLLEQQKQEVSKQHTEVLTSLNEIQKASEDTNSKLKKETQLNQFLNQKVTAQSQLIDVNKHRIERFEFRQDNTYFFYQRFLHNKKQEVKGNIRVFCRVRPIINEDIQISSSQKIPINPASQSHLSKKRILDLKIPIKTTYKTIEETQQLPILEDTLILTGDRGITIKGSAINNEVNKTQNGLEKPKKDEDYKFRFDHVFGPQAKQEQIFNEVKEVVRSALDGYKVCIFAYGQTGAGKTYTMEGGNTPDQMGLIPRSVQMIFETLDSYNKNEWSDIQVTISCIEVHIETVRDLLDPKNETAQIMTNTQKFKPAELEVQNFQEVEYVLKLARENRKVGQTALNEYSSRSHSIYQLKIRAKRGQNFIVDGALNLVDLAGSERVSQSKVEGDRMKETQSINKSLSCLGDVISAIIKKDSHIPYRNSKLTLLLQNYLGGDSKTLMIVNASPLQVNARETLTSLRFASKVNNCKQQIKK